NDTWALDFAADPTWSRVAVSDPPPPRDWHCAAYDPVRDRLVVFGGYAAPSPPYYQYDDLWTLSFAGGTPSWTRHDAPDPRPSARMLSTMVYDSKRDRFLLMFGVHDATLLTEVWELRFTPEATWRQIFPAFAGPVARAAAMGVFDPLRDRVV